MPRCDSATFPVVSSECLLCTRAVEPPWRRRVSALSANCATRIGTIRGMSGTSSFAEVLKSHHGGVLNRAQLLAEVDAVLASTPQDARQLLAYLEAEHAAERIAADSFTAAATRIRAWLEDRTVVSAAALKDDTVDVFQSTADADLPSAAAALLDDLPDEQVGKGSVLLHRFRLIEEVGEGGMSRVFKAIDLRRIEADSPDPYVAVKVLTARFEDYFRSSAVLHREAHKLQRLTHPNIVRVIDCDRDGQIVFMTMEYLEGESLKSRIDAAGARPISPAEAKRIVARIGEALEFAHRNGIVHGDLKPGNVILTSQGEVKVIDFGIARFIARPAMPDPDLAEEEIAALTPPYASPEMLEGAKPDARDDVYALACIAHELLVHEHPFGRLPANVARDRKRVVVRRDELTQSQFTAIRDALKFDRAWRTPTARAFIDQFGGPPKQTKRPYGVYTAIALAALVAGYFFSRQLGVPKPAPVKQPSVATSPQPGAVFRDCPTCPLMVVLPQGEYVQGSALAVGSAFERPEHKVAIGYALAMGQHEVTVGEFRDYVEATQQRISGCSVYDGAWRVREDVSWDTVDPEQTAVHPVACVSWRDAEGYAAWLASQTHQPYRLASASEWEYAAGAGRQTTKLRSDQVCSAGNVADESAAAAYPGWTVHECRDGYARAAPVGSFAANAFGLQDTLGNVFEWVQDCWHDNYAGAPADGSAWVAGDCKEREARGGSWFTTPDFVRPAYRNRFPAGERSATVGFRVVRVIGK